MNISLPVIATTVSSSYLILAQAVSPADSWYDFLKDFGFPTFVAVMLGATIVKIAIWFDARIAQPLLTALISLIKQVEESNKTQTETLLAQANTLEQMADAQKQSVSNQTQIAATQEKIFDLLENQVERRTTERRDPSQPK